MDARGLIRRLAAPVYAPTLFAYLGLGMLLVALPLYLTSEDVGLRLTSIVLAAPGAGAAVGALPVGGLISRLGERQVVVRSLMTMGASVIPLALTSNAVVLLAAGFCMGLGTVGFLLSAQTLVTQEIPISSRGRAMAYMGGSFRFAFLIGPAVGGVLVDALGFRPTFGIIAATILLATVPPLRFDADQTRRPTEASQTDHGSLLEAFSNHPWLVFITGTAQLLVMLVREGRLVILPLLSDDLGLSARQTGAVVAVSTAADLVLFPFAGWVMDRFGRLFTMIPSFLIITGGLVLLGIANSATGVVIAGAVIGVGNGLGSGSMLTLGGDLAPSESPGPFLAAVGAVRNIGRIVGALCVGFVGQALGLDGAAFALAGLMALAIVWVMIVIGETGESPP